MRRTTDRETNKDSSSRHQRSSVFDLKWNNKTKTFKWHTLWLIDRHTVRQSQWKLTSYDSVVDGFLIDQFRSSETEGSIIQWLFLTKLTFMNLKKKKYLKCESYAFLSGRYIPIFLDTHSFSVDFFNRPSNLYTLTICLWVFKHVLHFHVFHF